MNKAAQVYMKRCGYYITSLSRTVDGYWMMSKPFFHLPTQASFGELGKALLKALRASKDEVPSPTSDADSSFGPLAKLAGVKTWSAFSKRAKYCTIDSDGVTLTLTPAENKSPKGFFFLYDKETTAPADGSAESVGIAVVETLKASK